MKKLNGDQELLLFSARDALSAIERDGKVHRDRVDLIWRAIAADLLNDKDTARWARWIAKGVVCDVLNDKSQDRDDRALKALGLYGQGRYNGREKTTLEGILAFERISDWQSRLFGYESKSAQPKERNRNLLKSMRAAGCYHEVSDQNAIRRLKRLLQNTPQAS